MAFVMIDWMAAVGVAVAAAALIIVLLTGGLMARIAWYGCWRSRRRADVAVVLGARVVDGKASPMLRDRVRHGVALWRSGQVRQILLTGGRAADWGVAESEAARIVAEEMGVPTHVLICEDRSRTTWENMVEARHEMAARGWRRALIVSDPAHMFRSMAMARRAGVRAAPSPAITTRHRSRRNRLAFLLREARAYAAFCLVSRRSHR